MTSRLTQIIYSIFAPGTFFTASRSRILRWPKFVLLVIAVLPVFTSTALEVTPEELDAIRTARQLKKTDMQAARQHLKQALSLTRSAPLLFEAAVLEAEAGRKREALNYLNEVVTLDSSFPGAYKNRGQILAALGEVEPAIHDLLKGMKHTGIDEHTMKLLSQYYTEVGKPAAAEVGLRWSLLYDPDNLQLYQLLAANLFEQKRYAEAERMGRTTIELDRTDPTNWRLYVNALLAQEKYDAALDSLEVAQRITDDLPAELIQSMGDLYLQKGMTREAISAYRKVQAQSPMTIEQLKSLADAFIAFDDAKHAREITDMLLARDPDNPETLYYCACTARIMGDNEAACTLATRSVAANNGYARAWLLLSELHLDRGDFAKALDAARTARSFAATEVDALSVELELWMKQENWYEALAVVDLLIEKSQDSSWIHLRDSILDLVENPNL